MSSIFNYMADYRALEELIFQENGELNETLEQWLSECQRNLATKVDSYGYILDRLDSTSDELKRQAKRFSDAAKQVENARDRLKETVKTTLQVLEKNEIKGESFTFKLSNTAQRLVLDETALPENYKMQVTTIVPDKERIKSDLKEGKEIQGARLEGGKALRVTVSK